MVEMKNAPVSTPRFSPSPACLVGRLSVPSRGTHWNGLAGCGAAPMQSTGDLSMGRVSSCPAPVVTSTWRAWVGSSRGQRMIPCSAGKGHVSCRRALDQTVHPFCRHRMAREPMPCCSWILSTWQVVSLLSKAAHLSVGSKCRAAWEMSNSRSVKRLFLSA